MRYLNLFNNNINNNKKTNQRNIENLKDVDTSRLMTCIEMMADEGQAPQALCQTYDLFTIYCSLNILLLNL